MVTRHDVISSMLSSNFPVKLPVSCHIRGKQHGKYSKKQRIDKITFGLRALVLRENHSRSLSVGILKYKSLYYLGLLTFIIVRRKGKI